MYIQDQAKLDRFLLTLTGHYDSAINNTYNFLAVNPITKSTDTATTGRAALSYVLDGGVVPYISYSTNFDPTTGLDRLGQPFKPRTGETKEVGVKYQPFAGALFTGAVFDRIKATC